MYYNIFRSYLPGALQLELLSFYYGDTEGPVLETKNTNARSMFDLVSLACFGDCWPETSF